MRAIGKAAHRGREARGLLGSLVSARAGAYYAVLLAANLGAWGAAFLAFGDRPVLLGTALLAYSFGLRHAVDADHIAAIDNVTRKLMQERQRPIDAGFWFSLGHSSVVVLATLAIAATASALEARFAAFREIGGLVGTSVSALFLLAIAAVNCVVLAGVWRGFRAARRGERVDPEDLDLLLSRRGFLGRIFRPLFGLIRRPWHMYPLGFLFGLGFDTATEIGLLGIAATEASNGLSPWSILVFPALFTAGMSLVDTTDSVLMVGAYGWAFLKPLRKLYYNLVITFVSVAVALLVGGLEALGLVADRLGAEGWFWDGIAALNGGLGALGYVVVGVFVLAWAGSALIWRLRGYDALEPETAAGSGD